MYKYLTVFVLGGLTLAANAHTVTNLLVYSTKMDKDVPVTIVLPDGYVKGDGRYPSVYSLHGAGGSNAQVSNSVTTALADRYGVIAVGPDGGKTSWWLDSPIDPKYQYETFVVDELLPYVDAHFRTIPDRTQRGIMGGSMGGHGACYIGFRHTDLFGVVGNIYGGVDLMPWSGRWDIDKRLGARNDFPERWADYSAITAAKNVKNGEVDIICAIGTEDFFLGCNRQLHDLLAVNGVAHTYVEVREPAHLKSVHGKFYLRGVEICFRFIANYFRDGRGHLGDAIPAAEGVSSAKHAVLPPPLKVIEAEAFTNGLFGIPCEQARAVYAKGEIPLVVMTGAQPGSSAPKKVLIPDYCMTNGFVLAKVNMAEALMMAGFEAHVLPFTKDDGKIAAALAGMDALMVAGGWREQDYPRRCEFEHRVIRSALKLGLPIAGVCHGSQIINTYFGGTLELTPQKKGEKDFLIAHRMPVRTPYTDNFHLADLESCSRIARVLGSGRVVVNSSHSIHSCVMGAGLRVTARAQDGIVEAFEHETLPVMAFQFHPERMVFDRRFVELIRIALSRGG